MDGSGMAHPVRDIVVVGGSHAGLFAGIALRNAGFRVRIFERAPQVLQGTGGGIRVQPRLAAILQREAGIDLSQFATRTRYDRHLAPRSAGPGNRIVFEQAEEGAFASWSSLYRALVARFGRDDYVLGETCLDAIEASDGAVVRFAGGRSERADLVVYADGIGSAARARLNPSAVLQYAGYVVWRGLVRMDQLSGETRDLIRDARLFVIPGLSHVICYPVPGEDGEPGHRVNAMWYRNVPAGPALEDLMTDREGVHRPTSLKAGSVQQRHIDAFRRAVEAELPPAPAEIFAKAEPFVTTINDVEPFRMAFGRQLLIGDASAATRPHVSASTARALLAAVGLADALKRAGGMDEVRAELSAWEREHVAIAQEFTNRGRMIGRRLQVEGTFVPGDPELTQITMPVAG